MATPKDEKPDLPSEHLDSLARMLREIEDELSKDEVEKSPKTPPSST